MTAEDLGGGLVHTKISGVSDHLAENEEHALWLGRNIASSVKIFLSKLNTPTVDFDFSNIQ